MDLMNDIDSLLAVSWNKPPDHGDRVEPHGKIMEVLAVAVGILADARPRPMSSVAIAVLATLTP